MALAPYSLEVTRRLIAVDDAIAKGGQLATAYRHPAGNQPARLDLIVGQAVYSFTPTVGAAIVSRLTQDGYTGLAQQINDALPTVDEPPAPTADEIAAAIRQALDPQLDQDAALAALGMVRDEIERAAEVQDAKAERLERPQSATAYV